MIKITITVDDASLSARRAWIEIPRQVCLACRVVVALRKESVDRNRQRETDGLFFFGSLSARRAWIEIVEFHLFASSGVGRSPQGERG